MTRATLPARAQLWRALSLGCLAMLAACTSGIRACSPCLAAATLDLTGLVTAGESADTVSICIQGKCQTHSVATINGKPGAVLAGIGNGSTIHGLTVTVMNGHAVLRRAGAAGSIHVPPQPTDRTDCACHGVTIHYSATSGKLYGVPR